ncbi:MAG: hypothetical protein EBX50_02085 [Chitinophagia bacterium]|nr:hypothetical protein [Chitinophagia bacterium]
MRPKIEYQPIRNATDLGAAISLLQAQVREDEKAIVAQTRQIPIQGLKIVGLSIAELIAGRQGLSGITQLVQAAYFWIKGRKKHSDDQEKAKDKFNEGAGKLGLAGIIHLLGSVLKR